MPPNTRTRNLLFANAAGMCAFTDCTVDTDATTMEVAHIRSEQVDGPRHDPNYAAIDDLPNLVLLCPNHHDEVDRRRVAEWSVERLSRLKSDHEGWVLRALQRGTPTTATFGNVHYANLPRLAGLLALTGQRLAIPLMQVPISAQPLQAFAFLSELDEQISRWSLNCSRDDDPTNAVEGGLYLIEGRFRTKGMRTEYTTDPDAWRPSGNVLNDPHIYLGPQTGDRWVISIDPRYITSNSAFGVFTAGQVPLRAMIQPKYRMGKAVVASGLLIGSPPPPAWVTI